MHKSVAYAFILHSYYTNIAKLKVPFKVNVMVRTWSGDVQVRSNSNSN